MRMGKGAGNEEGSCLHNTTDLQEIDRNRICSTVIWRISEGGTIGVASTASNTLHLMGPIVIIPSVCR